MKVIIIISFLICSNCAVGQLVADFTTSDGKTGGCSPYMVSFKNLTTGASDKAVYKWDLGNNNTSENVNPGATYIDEKDYTITFTVLDSGHSASKSLHITVYKKPTADFVVDKIKGCIPFTVTYTSKSSANDGNIRSYFWDFGDGATTSKSGSDTITHTYIIAQKPSVRLVITNSYGCQNSVQQLNVTEAVEPPKSTFITDKTIVCKLYDAVNFKTTNTINDAVNYLWDFGDGTTSNQKSPAHAYSKKGTYDINLTVADATLPGCSSISTQPALISVANFSSDFVVSSPICNNTNMVLQNISLPSPSNSAWYFSDDNYMNVYNGNSLSRIFSKAGSLNIRLVNTFGVCKDTIEKKVVVNPAPVLPGFLVSNTTICGAPYTISFKDTSHTSAKWNWNFNVPNTNAVSTLQSPTYTYTANGNYQIALTVTDTAGCAATVTKALAFQKPDINIYLVSSTSPDKLKGCSGFTVKFAATNPAIISDYSWDFDDGASSNLAQPEHIFNQPKDYTISLNYTTTAGCKGTIVFGSKITVNQKPTADFTTSSNTVCGNSKVLFSDQSTPTSDRWSWSFGDNTYSGLSSNNRNITHQYSDAGSFTIQLISYNGGCSDTIEKKTLINVLPPFSKIISKTNTCEGTRGVVSFSQASKYTTDCKWDFGDGSVQTTDAGQTLINHDYKESGSYKVTLTTNYQECTAVDSITVYLLLKQQPVITSNKTELCGNDSLQVTVNNLIINPYQSANGYSILKWQYNDNSDFTGTVFSSTGNWTNILKSGLTNFKSGKEAMRAIVKSAYFGCTDTSTFIPLKINGPAADFIIANNSACYKSSLTFIDTSSRNKTIIINKRIWNFGDGSAWIVADSDTINHNYNNPGSYITTLKVIDDKGCYAVSTGATPVVVSGPKTNFKWSPIPVKPGAAATFLNTTYAFNCNNVQYLWRFSNNNYTDTASSKVIYKYKNISLDTVTLIAADAGSKCSDTSVQIVTINKMYTSFNFTSNYIDSNSCPPLVLYATGKTINADSVSWNFGDGSSAGNIPNPSHTYGKPGIYKITVFGYINDIVDSAVDYITIKGPYATLKADAYQKCTPATISLSATLKNAVSYIWDFNDGTLQLTSDTVVMHTYSKPGIYNPSLVMKDSAGCSAAFNLPAKILMDTLSANMNLSAHSVCDSTLVIFTSDVVSLAAGDLHQNLRYKWFFGTADNSVSDKQDAGFLYTTAGKYSVTLMVQSDPGCIVQVHDTVNVNPFPAVDAGPRKYILSGASDILTPIVSEDVLSYLWTPSLYLNSDTILNPVSTPLNNQKYTLTATTKAGCSKSDTVNVFVLAPINIPNVFSPNGDGINDTWKIKYLDDYPGATLDVFNRYGQPVFHSDGYSKEWDGTMNGKPLPIGTYYYVMNTRNWRPTVGGSITILR